VLLVDRWGERRMRDTLVATTVHYVRVMLASPKLRSITSERTLLKNLGAWLGKLTLANNRPVLQVRAWGVGGGGPHDVRL
jgi:CCR4-NOT transcription complex subunit 1